MGCNCCNNHEHCDMNEHNHEHKHEESSKLDKVLYIIGIIVIGISLIPILEKYKSILVLLGILLTGYKMIIEGILKKIL